MSLTRRLIFEICANCGKKVIDDEKAVLVDNHNDLIFCSDECVRENFETEIERLEEEHLALRKPKDVDLKDFKKYEYLLPLVLNEPDEIWELEGDEEQNPISSYLGEFLHEDETVFYVAMAYTSDEKPTFVYVHFPTKDPDLVEQYRRGMLAYDGDEEEFSEEELNDDLSEDALAQQLYQEMLEHRDESDIDPDDFGAYNDLKVLTLEKPDEIWRRIDDLGNTFIVYMGQYLRNEETVGYVVVTLSDEMTESARPLFGFPTLDHKLLERFRVGERVYNDDAEF